MARRILTLAFSILLVCLVAPAARAEVKQVMTARVQSQTQIASPAAPIWQRIVDGRSLGSWMPEWKQPRNARTRLARVGDWLDFVDEWKNRGRSVVTFVTANREIRFANEPIDGAFMCRTRITLTGGPQGTVVRLTEEYTDESAANDFNATAQKMQGSLDRALAALKSSVERAGGRSR